MRLFDYYLNVCAPAFCADFRTYSPSILKPQSDVIGPPYYSCYLSQQLNVPINGQLVCLKDVSTYTLGQEDSEPDIMKANFMGHCIQFIKDPKTGLIVVLNKKGYIINKIALSNNDFGWQITTPDGTNYFFNEIIKTTPYMYSFGTYSTGYTSEFVSQNLLNCGEYTPGGLDGLPHMSRIWQITKIKATNGEEINFVYKSSTFTKIDCSQNYQWDVMNCTQGPSIAASNWLGPLQYLESADPHVNGHNYEFILKSTSAISSVGTYLDHINFPNGKILFYLSDREDYNGSKKIDKVEIYSNESTIAKKTFKLNYDYFVADNNGMGSCFKSLNERLKRLRLLSFQEIGDSAYHFGYNSEKLPPKTSYAIDYWGFYNGKKDNSSPLPNILRLIDVNSNINSILNLNVTNNSSVLQYAKAGNLEQIIYPSGGKSIFEFELNEFSNNILPDFTYEPYPNNQTIRVANQQTVSHGFGLRVKSISNFDGNKISGKVGYSYDLGSTMIPLKLYRILSRNMVLWNPLNASPEFMYNGYSSYSSNLYCPSQLGSGNYVGYGKVSMVNYDTYNNVNGKSIKYYINTPDVIATIDDSYEMNLPSIKIGLDNGLIQQEEIYNNNQTTPIRLIKNYYHYLQNSIGYYGIHSHSLGTTGWSSMTDRNVLELINVTRSDLFGFYPILATESLLDSTITLNYDNSVGLKIKNWNLYNSNNLLSKTFKNKSDGSILETDYSHPDDANCYNPTLINANRLTEILFTENFKVNPSGKISLKRQYVSYKTSNGLTLPFRVMEATGNPYKFTFDGFIICDTLINYTKFDNSGKGLEFRSKDRVTTALLWGYNHTYPVAKIVGANYSDAIIGIDTTILNNPASDQVLRNELAKLRSNVKLIGPNVTTFISSYTYLPLIGMTSQTDPNGITTYYEYDKFGRLITLKDDDGRILKTYEYNIGH